MDKIRRFEDLATFQRARELCRKIYTITETEPFRHDLRFVQQIRAAAGSVMDNIAEGYERNGNKEFVNFLYIAKGSCGEVRSQLIRANDVGFIDDTIFHQLYDEVLEVGRKIYYLSETIRRTGNPENKYQ